MSKTATHRTLLVALAALFAGATLGGVHFGLAASPGTATSTVPVEPFRILDTRLGIGAPAAPVTSGQTIDVQIAGVGPVPADAVGVVLNLTGTRTTAATYITAWPTGGTQPTASVLNLTPGIDAPNSVTALLGTGGKLSLFNFTGSTDLIADVAGYLVASGSGAPGPQGPAGPQGPQGPGPFVIQTDIPVSPNAVTLGTWEGVTVRAFCSSSVSAGFGFAGSNGGLRVGGVLATLSATSLIDVESNAVNFVGSTGQHVTGTMRNLTTVGGRLVEIDLHANAGSPCTFYGTILPVG